MIRPTLLAAAALVAGLPNLTAAAILYSTPGGVYSENFNSLPTDVRASANIESGASAPQADYPNGWTDDTTTVSGDRVSLSGWYLYHPITQSEGGANDHQRLRFGTGSSNTGSFWAFASGANNSDATNPEKALGSLASNTMSAAGESMFLGLRLTNNTGQTLTQFTLTYNGEQWRNDGSPADPERLVFAYSLDATELQSGTFIVVPALDFVAPITDPNGAVDGNAAGRVNDISATVAGITWAPGADLWLRWADENNAGADDGLAIDDVRFTAVPEPAASALAAAAVAGMLFRRPRK